MTANDSSLRRARENISTTSPAFFASILGLIVGALMVAGGAYLLLKGNTPTTLGIAVICVGMMEAAASYYTVRCFRVAWAFAMSINGTAFVVFLFSSARIRDAVGTNIILALVPCLVFGFIVLLHALHSEEF